MGNRDGRNLSIGDFNKILELGTIDSGSESLFCGRRKKDVNEHVMTLVIGIGESGNSALLKAREIAHREIYDGYISFFTYLKFFALGSRQEELAPLECQGFDTLNLSLPDVQKRLQDKIAEYCAGDRFVGVHNQVNIMILTGLSEETDRGAFINTAVWAKHACPTPENVTVYGFLILPDPAHELAAFDEVLCSAKEPPYDLPFIMSGSFDGTAGAIAEMIAYFASVSGVSFNPQGFFANRPVIKGQKTAEIMSRRHITYSPAEFPESSFVYCSGGYAHASIPEKIVIPHVVGEVCRSLYVPSPGMGDAEPGAAPTAFCDRERPLNWQEYETAMRRLLGLTPNMVLKESSLWDRINRSMKGLCDPGENPVEISVHEIIEGNIGRYMQGFNVARGINSATEGMREVVMKELEMIKGNARAVMKSFGPRAMSCLYDGIGAPDERGIREDFSDICLKTQIEYVMSKLRNQRQGVMPSRIEPLQLWRKIFTVFARDKLEKWIVGAREYARMNIRYGVAQNLLGDDGIWQTGFVNPLMDFLWDTERFADVLETMSEYYESVGASLKSDDYWEFAIQGGDANGINLCRDAATYSWVKEKIRSKLASIRIQDVRDGLIDDFYMNTSAWTSDEVGTAREQFDKYMGETCVLGRYALPFSGVDITTYDYFENLTGSVPREQQQIVIDEVVRYIVEELLFMSKPMIKVSQDVSLMSYGAIMLPSSLTIIGKGWMIEEAFNRAMELANAKNIRLEFSEYIDSIVCYQVSAGNALWELAEFYLW